MCSKDCVADLVEVEACLVCLTEVHALGLGPFPTIDESLLHLVEVFQQCVPRLLSRLFWRSSKSKSRNALAVIRCQVEFGGQGNVPIGGTRIFPGHFLVGADVLPAIADAHVTTAHLSEWRRAN